MFSVRSLDSWGRQGRNLEFVADEIASQEALLAHHNFCGSWTIERQVSWGREISRTLHSECEAVIWNVVFAIRWF